MGEGPAGRRVAAASASDDDLLRRTGSGDSTAFEVLVQRHDRLLQAAAALCFDPTDREDALQRGLLDIWRGSPGYRGDSAVSTWMYSVASNAARRGGRRGRSVAFEPVADLPEDPSANDGWEDTSLRINATAAALRSLPDDQREALLLSTIGDLSYDEIAAMKIVAPGTVKSWVSRARAELSRQLKAADR